MRFGPISTAGMQAQYIFSTRLRPPANSAALAAAEYGTNG